MRWITLVALALVPAAVSGQRVSPADSFGLFCGCSPIRLDVLITAPNPSAVTALVKEDVEIVKTTFRSRMRAARIFTEETTNRVVMMDGREQLPLLVPKLRVIMGTPDEIGYRVMEVEFLRYVRVVFNDVMGWAPTWKRQSLFRDDSAQDLAAVLADQFIDEYLRVNEASCTNVGGGTT